MLAATRRIYRATRKKHDQVFNTYFMRPIAAGAVALLAHTPVTPNQLTLVSLGIFVVSAGLLCALPMTLGGMIAIGVLELSYMFDCADGMLARHKKIASKEGHLFDFFTDEIKATLLVGALGIRLWRTGGLGFDGTRWLPGRPEALLAAIAGVVVIASALSLTNFVRRPELTGKATPVEAYYETVDTKPARTVAGRVFGLVTTFLRFLNHYPSHIWIFALLGRLDLFFWIYLAINSLYLARGWLGIVRRFGLSR